MEFKYQKQEDKSEEEKERLIKSIEEIKNFRNEYKKRNDMLMDELTIAQKQLDDYLMPGILSPEEISLVEKYKIQLRSMERDTVYEYESSLKQMERYTSQHEERLREIISKGNKEKES
ncbi:MAG: hypothetical protein K5654_05565 [Lachnospiraceae bacterium]|nr:hypothetical protein [Lachnospiraceae bacterium]